MFKDATVAITPLLVADTICPRLTDPAVCTLHVASAASPVQALSLRGNGTDATCSVGPPIRRHVQNDVEEGPPGYAIVLVACGRSVNSAGNHI